MAGEDGVGRLGAGAEDGRARDAYEFWRARKGNKSIDDQKTAGYVLSIYLVMLLLLSKIQRVEENILVIAG